MSLPSLPADVLQRVGDFLVGEAEAAGLRGVSVIAREVAGVNRTSKSLLPLSASAWATLEGQIPQILYQLGVSDILNDHGYASLLGSPPVQGPVNMMNFQSPTLRKHSAGLHALSCVEKYFLREYLTSSKGPFATAQPARSALAQIRAPLAVKFMVAVEKCQFFWRTPSPVWRAAESRHLESIEMVRELLFGRYDRGMEPDAELTNLLDSHISHDLWPYGSCGRNTWWGFRKLVCDRWTPADIQAKLEQRRKTAGICLGCMGTAGKRCCHCRCAVCCQRRGLPCHVHQYRSASPLFKKTKTQQG